MMPVQNSISAGKVAAFCTVHKNRAADIVAAVGQMITVIRIVVALCNGVVDLGIGKAYPPDYVLADALKPILA